MFIYQFVRSIFYLIYLKTNELTIIKLNIQDNKGDTPLHKAAAANHIGLCQKLIRKLTNRFQV